MTEFLDIRDHLAALAELDELLRRQRCPIGSSAAGLSIYAGRVTRDHANIDIAIYSADRARLAAILRDHGWVHRPEVGQDGYTCYERNRSNSRSHFSRAMTTVRSTHSAGDGTPRIP